MTLVNLCLHHKFILDRRFQFLSQARHLREVLIFCLHLKKTAAEAHRMLSSIYGEEIGFLMSCSRETSKPVKIYLETLKWEVLLQPPYSPDVAPSDYHLLRSMAHSLAHQHFRSYEEVKK